MATLNNRGEHLGQQRVRAAGPTPTATSCPTATCEPGAQTRSGGDICGALNAPLGSLNIAAHYDPKITSGFGVRPNDQEVAVGVQQQIAAARGARLPVHASLVRQLRREPEHLAAAVGVRLVLRDAPRDRDQQRLHAAQRRRSRSAASTISTRRSRRRCRSSKSAGEQLRRRSDVYTGYDLNLNARLPRGGMASGGVSIGHEVTDICEVAGEASVTYARSRRRGVLVGNAAPTTVDQRRRLRRARCTATSSRRSSLTSRGWSAIRCRGGACTASATIQNRPGPQILATYTVDQRHGAEPSAAPLNGGTATTGSSRRGRCTAIASRRSTSASGQELQVRRTPDCRRRWTSTTC